jgi:hypothetical protein
MGTDEPLMTVDFMAEGCNVDCSSHILGSPRPISADMRRIFAEFRKIVAP